MQARLDGRPLVAHVLEAARAAGLRRLVLVLGRDAATVRADLLAADPAALDGVLVAVNPAAERGLATSLRLGLAAAAADPRPDGVLILLGDQPRVRPAALSALLTAVAPPDAVAVVADHAGDHAPNPVLLLLPHGAALVRELDGDRGFGPLLAARPERVLRVAVGGRNPDVDTPGDLAALGGNHVKPDPWAVEAAWAARVRAHHAQTARVRETPEGGDFYAPVSRLFVADPHRTDDEVLVHLVPLARPDDTWLDIGAGAGRYALPLALRVREVIALDPSPGMLAALREQATEHRIANVRTIEGRWPVDPALGPAPTADVALIAHLGYDVEAIGPFLDAMEAAAQRLCVAVLADRQPSAPAHAFWPPVHGEARIELPALDDFLDVLRARGRDPREVRVARPHRDFPTRDELERWLRNQLFVEPGSAKHALLEREIDARLMSHPDGSVGLSASVVLSTGIVAWEPR